MRGVGQGKVEEAVKAADAKYPEQDDVVQEGEWSKYYLATLIASNIIKVTDVEGNEDNSEFTAEDMLEIRAIVPIDSWSAIVETMQKLTLAGSYFEAVTDAGFLQKS